MDSSNGVKHVAAQVGDKEISFETGKMAMQANAAVVARQGDTVVLAACVLGRVRENIDYFPLLLDYEERLYAAGKIKGSRWVKREGRASEEAILTGRVVDRSLRPMFPDGMRNDVQVVVTVLSYDEENEPDILAVNAASTALTISDIPFLGPIACVRVGKIDDQFILNPTTAQRELSKMDLIVSGNAEHIIMVEAGAKLVSEEDIVGGVAFAQEYLKVLCKEQEDLRQAAGKEKAAVDYYKINDTIYNKVKEILTEERLDKAIYVDDMYVRNQNIKDLQAEVLEEAKKIFLSPENVPSEDIIERIEEKFLKVEIANSFDKIKKDYIQKNIFEKERRMDGRALDQTRKVTCEVGVLPRTHGSALFTRGETQVLTTVTLGSKGDEQL